MSKLDTSAPPTVSPNDAGPQDPWERVGRMVAPGTVRPTRLADAIPRAGVPRWKRRPRPALSDDAHRLVIAMHRANEPILRLARGFPHLVNRLAAAWHDPDLALSTIDDLLADRRGGRRGFPADALAELLTVRAVCEARLAKGSRMGVAD